MKKVTTLVLTGVLGVAAMASIASASNGVHDPGAGGQGVGATSQLVLYANRDACQDCFADGISLRDSGSPASGLAGGIISIPPQVAANAVWAQIFWVTLDAAPPVVGPVAVNGFLVAPVANGPVTPSPCFAEPFAFSYRADVLPFIVAGFNSLTGFPDSGALNVAPETEGVSIVIVYNSTTVDKEIIILGGNDHFPSASRYDVAIPTASAANLGAELTLIVGDGQSNGLDGLPDAGDEALWNGAAISSPNAFRGLDGGPGIGLWDTEEYGVATGGINTVSVSTVGFTDCLNWVATVFCVKKGGCVVPVEPSTWSKIKNLPN